MFTKAITRTPGSNYEDGLTTVELGVPDFQKTLAEYARYLQALKQCGLALIELPADLRYPDGTFVEDTAILIPDSARGGSAAILTHPGAESRAGEVVDMRRILDQFYPELAEIRVPGSLDGGDICEAGTHFFIGISLRTNEAGAQQLADLLASKGYTSSFIDIRQTPGILHLKSGIAYIGDNRLVVIDALASHPAFQGYELVRVAPGEEYAANCIRVNDRILIAAGFPKFEATLRGLGYQLIVLDMSEFQKMDGGLSCLSLRF
jgi:dimethylargininase